MASGVTHRRSGDGVHRSGRRDRRPTRHSPERLSRRTHARSARAARFNAASASSTRRSRTASSINNYCVITDSHVAARRASSARSRTSGRSRDVGEDAHVGNFVELKKTTLGRGSKANHLAYLGDATIGEKVNVGAGTITCNYDGKQKHPTVDRGRRVHRQRFAADRAGARRQGRLRRRRLVDHRERPCRRARRSRAASRSTKRAGSRSEEEAS